jgi:hypothetical protein
LETKKGGVEAPKAKIVVKSLSWELSRVSGPLIYPGPICADTITLGGCCFFAAHTRVSSAFEMKGDSIVVAIFLEKNCLTKGKLFSVAFYKSFDSESVDFSACAPHVIDDVFNGRWLPFGPSP